jgi:hypothetical protein
MAQFSRLKGTILGILVSLLSVSLCLFLIESYLAIQYQKNRERLEESKPGEILCTRRSESPELIYTRVPNKCGANSHGFRDREYAYQKTDGAAAIALSDFIQKDSYLPNP